MSRNLRDIVDEEQSISLYYAQIDCRLCYDFCLWVTSSNTLFLIQKQIVRSTAADLCRESCHSFKKLNVFTF